MPVVIVKMWEGRTLDQKRGIVKGITDTFVNVAKTAPDAVTVILEEYSKSNWAKGGKLSSEG